MVDSYSPSYEFMPINQLAPYRFTKEQRNAVEQYLTGKMGINEAAAVFGATRQRMYTIVSLIARHAATTGAINAKELLKKY